MPLMTILLIFSVLISPCADNHVIRTAGAPSVPRQDVATTFDGWMRDLAKSDTRPNPPVFIVATEGGGIRAAYWTAAVLGTLHDATDGAFTRHLFAISGVSGGSVCAVADETAV